jgi:hypothetical protein
MIRLDDVVTTARLAAGLPGFLRHPITVADARIVLGRRLQDRALDFLALVRRGIYEHAPSPYRPLLRRAGCEYGDLESLVRQDGVEGALRALLRRGVYLTVEELRGRRPVVRGSLAFAVEPGALCNPGARVVLSSRSSSGRGTGTSVPMDLVHLKDRAVNTLLAMDARGGAAWTKAQWLVPGGGALAQLLEFSRFGRPVRRWFTQVDPARLAPRYRWSARVVRGSSLLAGTPLPSPEHATLEDPSAIIHWMQSVLREDAVPHLFTFASSALRLCDMARERGGDLSGVQFTVTGEPLTAARLASLRRCGSTALPRYAITECGALGFGCVASSEPDEVHVPQDLHGLIQAEDAADAGVPGQSLFVSSIRPTAPLVLLNFSTGDQAEMTTRECGCALQRLGWTTHLHTVRSHEKLTAGGMTFLDVDVLRVLEDVLPARFGGGPGDYQLVEEETPDGRPQLWLLVRPGVGLADLEAVAGAFLTAIGAGSQAEQVMSLVWRNARFLGVKRRAPVVLPSGKIRTIHLLSGVAVHSDGGKPR